METSVIRQIAAFKKMTVGELRVEWERLYGEPSRSRNRDYLWRRLAWRVQDLAHGGLSDAAKARIEALAPDSFTRARTPRAAVDALLATSQHQADPNPYRTRDPRLPASGTVITKTYKDRELRVVVCDDGYEFDGSMYPSLTALAKKITGCTSINGLLFFGLTERNRRP